MFNNNKMIMRSLDHSVPQMLVFAGELKEKNIRNHPDRNRLLRVLGARNVDLKVDYSDEYTIDDCQAFLLCSDGFWECITERKMCKFLKKSKSVQEWLDMMVKEVEKNGKGTNMDNNSAIAVWVKEKRSGLLWM
jgi:serine/threonine protein phosphatase PrpC